MENREQQYYRNISRIAAALEKLVIIALELAERTYTDFKIK